MIKSLHVADVATYSAAGATMGPLSVCNFVYGPNGSGKTTLSRYLAPNDNELHGRCAIVWENGRQLRTVVYNRDFLETIFNERSRVKGVFTLGSEDAALKVRIEELTRNLTSERESEQRLAITLEGDDGKGGKRAELDEAAKALKAACLKQTRKHEEEFEPALAGVRANSALFMARFLEERRSNQAALCDFEDLKERARSVFAENPAQINLLPIPDGTRLKILESDTIFKKPVVGKGDVNIAGLITRLKNSDWITEGVEFFQQSRPQCPFCQQEVPNTLERELAAFFDESFITDKARLDRVALDYTEQADLVVKTLEALSIAPVSHHDPEELSRLRNVFDARLATARLLVTRKVEAPSTIVDIEGVEIALTDIGTYVATANALIAEHNRRISNAVNEKHALTADFWRYLIDVELKDAAATYDKVNDTVGRAVQSLESQIQKSRTEQSKLIREREELEKISTSTQPTVDKINHTLKSFNFTNFHLATTDEPHTYQLIRANGDAAHHSLSEGEKTFITFLYFYHLAQAGDSATDVEEDRVVVIDDPICSLDSDVLFIVSALVREIADAAREATGPIKQLLVLTHNVYFHKEITFAKGGGSLSKTAYWVCRKKGGWTELAGPQNFNPVKSTYQLLWHDIRKPEGHSVTLPNTMRRIFESYFKLVGGVDVDKAAKDFEGDERLACGALLAWANDGSHAVHDDIYMVPSENADELYLDVFRRIFDNLGHAGHYRLMMGEDFSERAVRKEAA
jgi:wobble nucleotide-excising tRNase